MDDLFIIAAGGSGAKVCEALIHLCAAGLGPPNIYILLVDGDAANGNRNRTVETIASYLELQKWPWSIQPRDNPDRKVRLFRSTITVFSLAERFAPDNKVGLEAQIRDDAELLAAMRVLLDESELKADLTVGFTGRPNLGSVVMDRHLRTAFKTNKEAKLFVEQMKTSASSQGQPRVIVVGSVFGGTGASLLPVVQRCVESVFISAGGKPGTTKEADNTGKTLFDKLVWGKLMQLPYFYPAKSDKLKLASPDRYLMDTANALWYYGVAAKGAAAMAGRTPEPIYLIGSEFPERRFIFGADGGADQVNPAFYHEILGALAILDFYQRPTVTDGRSVRHFSSRQVEEKCALEKLPIPFGMTRDAVFQRLGALLQLAAFAILVRQASEEYYRGLFEYAKTAGITGWDDAIQRTIDGDRSSLEKENGPGKHAVSYFGRLLLWAATSLGSAKFSASGLEFENRHIYASLHNTLCYVKGTEFCVGDGDQPFAEITDNLPARLCRLALAGMFREFDSFDDPTAKGHTFNLVALRMVIDSKRIQLGFPAEWIGPLLLLHKLDKQEVVNLCERFGLPEYGPKSDVLA